MFLTQKAAPILGSKKRPQKRAPPAPVLKKDNEQLRRPPFWGPRSGPQNGGRFALHFANKRAPPALRRNCGRSVLATTSTLRSCATHDGRLHAAHVQQLSAKSFGQARLRALTGSRIAHSASAMFLTQKAAPILGSKKRPQKRAPPAPVLKKDNEQLRRPPFWGPRSGPQNGGRFALHFANKRAPPALRRNCGRSVLATTSTLRSCATHDGRLHAAHVQQLGRPVRTALDLERFLDPVLGAACPMCFTGS